MKNLYLALIMIESSCTSSLEYIGAYFPPTKNVDVFVSESAIKKPYDIVGKSVVPNRLIGLRLEKMQSRAIVKARQKGADAILIMDYFVDDWYHLKGISRIDSLSNGTKSVSNHRIQGSPFENFEILYLKYSH
jgi:hypothetical protein